VNADRGRGWAWAAFVTAAVLLALLLPTWGFSLLLAPIPIALNVVASFRGRRDGVFWSAVALNALLLLGLIAKLRELQSLT
jgi:hypothetical protein